MKENELFKNVGLLENTDKDIPEHLRDFGNDNGVYLEAVELQNWGPFSGLTEIPLLGMPSLLVGENGTGKSSLMDAILTLLVSKGLRYNNASDNKKASVSDDRSLMEYVLGIPETKLSGREDGQPVKRFYLRKTGEVTIVLLRFRTGTEFLTLAQAYLAEENRKDPQRFYVFAERPLSIRADFTAEADNFEEYRNAIGRLKGVTATADRGKYFAFVREKVGLADYNSMRLLCNMSSMKSMSDTDVFIRSHMLRNGDDLWAAYDGMKTAIRDMEEVGRKLMDEQKRCRMLEAMAPFLEKAKSLQEEADLWNALPAKIQPFVFLQGKDAAMREIRSLEEKQADIGRKIQKLEANRDNNMRLQARLEAKREHEGGAAVAAKKAELAALYSEKDRRESLYGQFTGVLRQLGITDAIRTELAFTGVSDTLRKKRSESDNVYEKKVSERNQAEAERDKAAAKLRALEAERRRLLVDKTAVDGRLVAVRDEVCAALGVSKDTMPFLGSYLSVREGEEAWRPALEHLLYQKSVSFLVPADMRTKVSAFLRDHRRSGTHIRYLVMAPVKDTGDDGEKAAWTKITVRQGEPYTAWVESYLKSFASNRCCDTPEEFAKYFPSMTADGQIRQNRFVHGKDERIDIFNPNNFMMSGSFEERLQALDTEIADAEAAVSDTRRAFVAAENALRRIREEKALLDTVPFVSAFSAIDTDSVQNSIMDLETAVRELEQDRKLEELDARILEMEEKRETILADIETLRKEATPTTEALGYLRKQTELLETQVSDLSFTDRERSVLEELYGRYKPESQRPKFSSIMEVSPKISNRVTRRIKEISPELEEARSGMEVNQRRYLDEFRGRRTELEPGLAMADAWLAELERSRDDFLPAAKDAYDKVVDYQNLGAVKRFIIAANMDQDIKKSIEDVNRVLRQVPYSRGTHPTFLQVNCLPNRNGDIVMLRNILSAIAKACRTQDISEVRPEEAEAVFNATSELTSFLEAHKIRIRKETYSEDNLLDQRNWYTFPVSVCREETMGNGETEIVHVKELTKTNKQSSGEGEKFTYFILAACFAVWMHLLDKDYAGRTFRFLMIDEIGNKLSPSNLRDVIYLFMLLRIQLVSILPQGDKVSEYEGFVGNVIQTDWLDKSIGTSFVDTLSLTGYAARNRERTEDRIRQGRDALARAKAVIDDVNNGKDKS